MNMSRRNLLRSAGTALALPWFESLGLAAPAQQKKFVFVYFPIGAYPSAWKFQPGSSGGPGSIGALSPLQRHFSRVCVIRNLHNPFCQLDGAGHHARGASTWLTSQRIAKDVANYRLMGGGKSADHLIAEALGPTSVKVLAVSPNDGGGDGNCDSGYSCSYTRNISWQSHTTSTPRFTDPKVLFDDLFPSAEAGASNAGGAAQKSVIDFVKQQADDLARGLSGSDRQKLDQYLTSVRELERRLSAPQVSARRPGPASA